MFFLSVILFVFGLCIGSFLNVVIWRVPRGISIVYPRSSCPECKKTLNWYELIPVISFAIQKGHCRSCQSRIHWRYPLIELITGILFVLVGLKSQNVGEMFAGLVFCSYLVPLAVIDFEHQILPNPLTVSGLGVGLVLSAFQYTIPLRDSLIGIAVGGGLLLIVALLSKGGMGLGDVKFLALIGSFVGGYGALITLFAASLLGSVYGIIYLAITKQGRKTPIPFGPFLAIGGLVTFFFL